MSEAPHTTKHSKQEHGTTQSYVIGFILSLIFTIIPYYLVVEKVLSGNVLLMTILGIAVLQMFIQIFFFLHLGRGPKPFYNIVFFFGTAGIIVIVIGASLFIMNNLYHNMTPEEVTVRLAQDEAISQVGGVDTGACQTNKGNHVVVLSEGTINPSKIRAERCDTVTFLNSTGDSRSIAFGVHPDDVSYGGLFEIVLDDDRPEVITLNEVGEFILHDHDNEGLSGQLIVTP